MLNFRKITSLFLAVLMLCGGLTGLSVISVSAEEETISPEEEAEIRTATYHDTQYKSPQDKLATMKKWTDRGNYILYADEKSGEVAVQDKATGQILFTNPYDIGYSKADTSVKNELMSQIIVTFAEVGDDNKKTYTSFEQAAVKDQIKIKNIKNGLRVEYTIGREEARRLVPRSIEESRFKELILEPMGEYYGIPYEDALKIMADRDNSDASLNSSAFYFKKQIDNFLYKSLDDAVNDTMKRDMLNMYPVLDDMDIYVLDPQLNSLQIEKIEQVIKVACPDYTYEEMDYDHQMTEYVSEEENPPLFKMALEYTLDETGVNVRLPANSIRFNESSFEVLNLQVLPYLGAGNTTYDGYAFFPDGSGTLFTFEDMKVNSPNGESLTAKIYGEDYAYHNLEMKYQQVTRYPVYGVVEDTKYYDFIQYDETLGEEVVTTVNSAAYDLAKQAVENGTTATLPNDDLKNVANLIENAEMVERIEQRGFAAIVEEGEALASLTYNHGGVVHQYDSIALVCNPRPRDQYNLADAISVGNNTTVSVVTKRKYTGSYRIRLVMLADENLAADAVESGAIKEGGWYEASWLGMATAYRDRLVQKGVLTPLDESSVQEDIPMYIESFGALETIEKFLSIPREVKRALTSAENVYTMYTELSREGVANINFKFTGFANGGMYATVPYGLKWEKSVSSKKDMTMQELFDKAAASNGQLGIYPEFNFSYSSATKMFDGFSMRKHAIRTIDDRYAYKREYMATQQRYAGYYQLAISPAYFEHFYTKFMDEYLEYDNVGGISVGSLGSDLNSDFDEDEPYNRENAKAYVSKALQYISNSNKGNMKVMVDGGNAYTWQYVDHILGAAVDSSRYLSASYSVPFLGVVLHGYVNFTGSPLNMEGDVEYAKLKAIENGASVYFTLSYQNTQNLKDDTYLSKYYSVRYDIWFDDVVEIYNELNAEMKDLQTMLIFDHDFLAGVRVPDTDELDRDLEAEFNEVMNFQGNQRAFLEQMKNDSVADARKHISTMGDTIKALIKNSTGYYAGVSSASNATLQYLNKGFLHALSNYRIAYAELEAVKADTAAETEDLTAAVEELERCQRNLTRAISNMAKNIVKIQNTLDEIDALVATAEDGLNLILALGDDCPANIKAEVQALYDEALTYRDAMTGMDFTYTSENLALQTFLELQYLLVIGETTGEPNFNGDKVIGLLEKQILTLTENKYGLVKDPATYVFLRYLDENSALTDAQLDVKYDLSDATPSLDGLVLYIRELLGDDVVFDPLLSDDMVDEQIREYVKTKFLIKLSSENDYNQLEINGAAGVRLFLQYLHLNPYKTGTTVVNNTNLFPVFAGVRSTLKTLTTEELQQIVDGDYRLESIVTPEEMDTYVAAIKDKILAEEATGKVEYLTPETLDEDIRNCIEVYYYANVLKNVVPASESALSVLKTTTNVTDSLQTLYEIDTKHCATLASSGARLAAYADVYFNRTADARISAINAALESVYGDVTAELKAYYWQFFVNQILANETEVRLSAGKNDAASAPDNTKDLNNKASALLEAGLSVGMDVSDLADLITDIVTLHNEYPAPSNSGATANYNIEDAVKAYVYRAYFKMIQESETPVTVHGYFYNSDLMAMDVILLAKVEEKKAALMTELGSEYSSFEYMDAVLAVLAGDDTQSVIDEAVAKISKYATVNQKSTLRDDVTDYYTYLLLNCLESAAMTDIDAYDSADVKTVGTFMDDRVNELLAKARRSRIYSMEQFLTQGEFTALIDDAYAALGKDSVTKEQVGEMVKYHFYTAVVKNLNCEKLVAFNLHQIYAGTLQEAAQNLKALAKYYTLAYTNMSSDAVFTDGTKITDEAFEDCFVIKTEVEEDVVDDEASRYVSDDGRIVSVTYGQKTSVGTYAAYKTFILNYNNFSVQVTYNGFTYTIPAYGYVTVYYKN